MRNIIIAVLVLCLVNSACQKASSPEGTVSSATAVEAPLFYHIFIRSFADSNGDQNGDLQGIIQSLDYLQSLGVTGILLTPLYPSQFYHNYFADDFYGIDPEFGGMSDYVALVEELHDRGMKIILDQEIQYVSGQHEWYQDALQDPSSPWDGFALFEDEQNEQPVGTLFGRTEFDVWPSQRQTIVTVDMLNPQVRDYFTTYLKFWMDPNGDGDFSDGVDGYRIDHMMDDLDYAGILTDLFAQFWIPVFDELRATNPEIRIIAEQADWGYGEVFLNQGEADMVFGFPIWNATQNLDASKYSEAVTRTNEVITGAHDQFLFIENHDTHRFASRVDGDLSILKLGAAVNLLSGWTPIIYYGQEIGMTGEKAESEEAAQALAASIDDARDIPIRQAFRWHKEHADGSLATWYRADEQSYPLPDSNQPGDGVSVTEQDGQPESLLSTYREIAKLRREHPALAIGKTEVVQNTGDVVVILRRTESSAALVAFNFGETSEKIDLLSKGQKPMMRYGESDLNRVGDTLELELPPYGVGVWTLE